MYISRVFSGIYKNKFDVFKYSFIPLFNIISNTCSVDKFYQYRSSLHIRNLFLCITVVSVIYGVSATVSFEELCREIILLDCSQLTVDTDETVCDSNGNSYMNLWVVNLFTLPVSGLTVYLCTLSVWLHLTEKNGSVHGFCSICNITQQISMVMELLFIRLTPLAIGLKDLLRKT